MKSLSLNFLLLSGILVVSLMLLSSNPCWASSSTTTSLGMSIAESNVELEFMIGPEFGRMLPSYPGTRTYDNLNKGQAYACGRNQRYCLPDKNPKGGPRCALLNRSC